MYRIFSILTAVIMLFSLTHRAYAQDSAAAPAVTADSPQVAADTGTVTTDKTGMAGPIIDKLFPVLITGLVSAFWWVVGKLAPPWKKVPEVGKWIALYVTGFLLTKTGLFGVVDGQTLTAAGVLAMAETGAAGLIFKLGGHKVVPPPVVVEASTARKR